MKATQFIIAEILLGSLLGGVTFYALIWQPVWLQTLSALAMAAGFFALMFRLCRNTVFCSVVMWACPLTYTTWWVGFLNSNASFFAVVLGHYAAGVLLLRFHMMLNKRFWT
jgi:hypothetical protein